jgi:hypothetical protein
MCLALSSMSRSARKESGLPLSPIIRVSVSPQRTSRHRVTPWTKAIEPGKRDRVHHRNYERICAPRPDHPTSTALYVDFRRWPTPAIFRNQSHELATETDTKIVNCQKSKTLKGMAERVGFEPTVGFPLHSLSRRALSTAQTPLRGGSLAIVADRFAFQQSGRRGRCRQW